MAGATLGLMAVVCVVWADVEGAPTDGNYLTYYLDFILYSYYGMCPYNREYA